MSGLLEGLPSAQRERLRPARPAYEIRPMLAVLSDRRSFDGDWLFERKLDGVRALAHREGDRGGLTSRSGKPMSATYPEVREALDAQDRADFVVDGEVVALDRQGRTSFELLQRRMQLTDARRARATGVAVTFYVFDLLRLDGHDLTRLPLRTRKALLRRALKWHDPLRFTTHRNAWDPALLDEACGRGWEGLIAKRADARYVEKRSGDWLKLKCAAGQEMVVGGFTEPAGSRTGFGALLVGYYAHGTLRYAGKVGTGFDTATLNRLRRRFDALRRSTSPFGEPVRESGAHWIAPELVAQIAFAEWTRDGKLRHPRFLGLRDDKRPEEVVRERAA
ncbi:non-homologous end-joining DNA ligase [Streptomyces sp. PTM05]|uniref:DNA ligase (ATP) n=1 Tax=Streptantibioticus parmotrematis TaxID=2873249 RepID=A0ABS7QLR4_9ACTN|nr:non-homologous end-joining DNA ligase [Streptantibioticus parmotrematis]MBY8883320.1 non-homologous end-joining DNA ligase [Streptantibioticus parmotrematis]